MRAQELSRQERARGKESPSRASAASFSRKIECVWSAEDDALVDHPIAQYLRHAAARSTIPGCRRRGSGGAEAAPIAPASPRAPRDERRARVDPRKRGDVVPCEKTTPGAPRRARHVPPRRPADAARLDPRALRPATSTHGAAAVPRWIWRAQRRSSSRRSAGTPSPRAEEVVLDARVVGAERRSTGCRPPLPSEPPLALERHPSDGAANEVMPPDVMAPSDGDLGIRSRDARE